LNRFRFRFKQLVDVRFETAENLRRDEIISGKEQATK